MGCSGRIHLGAGLLVALAAVSSPAGASGFGDWSEVGPNLARAAGAVLPEATLRSTESGLRGGLAWELPFVLTSCDPEWCRRPGRNLGPRNHTQLSTVPAFRWYPSEGKLGGRLTERWWLFTNGWDWNPAVSVGAGWFAFGRAHGPTVELRLWLGTVMYGSDTRGRAVGFFLGGALERSLKDEPLRVEMCAGIEAPLYLDWL